MANVTYQGSRPSAPPADTTIKTTTVDGAEVQHVNVDTLAAGDNNIGNVDLASSIPAGTNQIGFVKVDIGASTQQQMQSDGLTRSIVVIDYEHHEIHGGSMYSIQFEDLSMANNDVLDIKIITPATGPQMHLLWDVYGSEAHTIQLVEASTVTAGTGITPYNWNRNSANVSGATITHTPTGTVGGTAIYSRRFGAGKTGAQSRGLGERVLKLNTTYLFRVTANSAGMVVSVELDWYEHTPI